MSKMNFLILKIFTLFTSISAFGMEELKHDPDPWKQSHQLPEDICPITNESSWDAKDFKFGPRLLQETCETAQLTDAIKDIELKLETPRSNTTTMLESSSTSPPEKLPLRKRKPRKSKPHPEPPPPPLNDSKFRENQKALRALQTHHADQLAIKDIFMKEKMKALQNFQTNMTDFYQQFIISGLNLLDPYAEQFFFITYQESLNKLKAQWNDLDLQLAEILAE